MATSQELSVQEALRLFARLQLSDGAGNLTETIEALLGDTRTPPNEERPFLESLLGGIRILRLASKPEDATTKDLMQSLHSSDWGEFCAVLNLLGSGCCAESVVTQEVLELLAVWLKDPTKRQRTLLRNVDYCSIQERLARTILDIYTSYAGRLERQLMRVLARIVSEAIQLGLDPDAQAADSAPL